MSTEPSHGYRGHERQTIERKDLIHPHHYQRRTTTRCDGVRKAEGGDSHIWNGTQTKPNAAPFASALTNTKHPRYDQHMTIRETTNQQAELEKTMFPDEEQLEAFHLTDTLRVVNIQQGAGGAIYPLEGGTTTGDQQNDLHLADVRLRPVVPHSSRFVPSHTNLEARQEALASTGNRVILPINKHTGNDWSGREDNANLGRQAHVSESEAKSTFKGPPGFAGPAEITTDLAVETRFRRGKSEFNGHDGAPEMYNR